MVLLEQSRVCDNQLAAVQHQVGHQRVAEVRDPAPEPLFLSGQLFHGLLQPVGQGDLAAAQRPHQLVFVVAGHGERVAVADHPHGQAKHARRIGSAVDEVTHEDDPPTLGVFCVRWPSRAVARQHVAQRPEQQHQLVQAAVDIADHVEGAVFLAEIVEQLVAADHRVVYFIRGGKHVHPGETLPAQGTQRLLQGPVLAVDHRRRHCSRATRGIAFKAHLDRQVQDDGRDERVLRLRNLHQLLPGGLLHVGGVNHREQAGLEALGGHEAQRLEGRRCHRLVARVVPDQSAERVAGKHLELPEVFRREA